jgi:hypothetical protein
LRVDFFGRLQAAKPFESAGKANPFPAEFEANQPAALLATCPRITALYKEQILHHAA